MVYSRPRASKINDCTKDGDVAAMIGGIAWCIKDLALSATGAFVVWATQRGVKNCARSRGVVA